MGPKDSKDRSKFQNLAAKLLWLISTSRNIIVVVCCALIAYYDEDVGSKNPKFVLSGKYNINFINTAPIDEIFF